MHVLVAAEKILNEIITEILDEIGVTVTAVEPAFNKNNILKALKQEPYDLVILTNSDLSPHELPSLAEQIKLEYPAIKIIIASGFVTNGLVNSLAVEGIDVFMMLPFKIVELQAVVRRVLRIESAINTSTYQT